MLSVPPAREPLRRARYYQSMIDLASMERGASFTALKDSYIIFLGLEDFFGNGLSCYRFAMTCPDLPERVNDGTHAIFVNAAGDLKESGPGFASLMAYLKDDPPSDDLTHAIDGAVEVVRERRDLRREYMTFQEIIDKEKELSFEEAVSQDYDLFIALQRDGRLDDFARALKDKDVRNALLKEYSL